MNIVLEENTKVYLQDLLAKAAMPHCGVLVPFFRQARISKSQIIRMSLQNVLKNNITKKH